METAQQRTMLQWTKMDATDVSVSLYVVFVVICTATPLYSPPPIKPISDFLSVPPRTRILYGKRSYFIIPLRIEIVIYLLNMTIECL